MEKEIVKEFDKLFETQNEVNWYLLDAIKSNESRIKQLTKEINMLIIVQGLCALALLVTSIWG